MKKPNMSLGARLLIFLVVLILIIVLGFILLLMVTGVFNQGKDESGKVIESQLTSLSHDVSDDFGKISAQGIVMSKIISANIEEMKPGDFSNNPKVMEDILNRQADSIISFLRVAKCSGAFMILDGTVNKTLPNWRESKAGIYFKSTEPNVINSIDVNIRYLRGPAEIARQRNIELLPQWKQEFDTKVFTDFNTVVENAKNKSKTLSQLYHWTNRFLVDGGGEPAMLLYVPLIGSNGTIYGVCGFEISSMLFKLEYSPENTLYHKIFFTLAPYKNDLISINQGLIAGNYYMLNCMTLAEMSVQSMDKGIVEYIAKDDDVFCGSHQFIKLYPEGSQYDRELWTGAVIMPESDLDTIIAAKNKKLYLSVGFLLLISLLLAVLFSKSYLTPILSALNEIKSDEYKNSEKTKIAEIDDLFAFLAEKDQQKDSMAHSTAMFETFMKNIAQLSPAEKAVFDLYIEGHTAKEITEILYLSINTIKTHNKRIYEKLNVSSRKELLIYIEMMKELGKK